MSISTPAPTGAYPEAICLGMAVTDILVKGVSEVTLDGRTTFAESITMKTGGDAVNEAITLSNLEHKPALMTLVGNDAQGSFLLESLAAEGVDTTGVAVSSAYPTSTSVVLIGKNGERSFLSCKGGTAAKYGITDIDLDRIAAPLKVLSIASLFCSEELNEKELLQILKKAKEAGATTIADLVLDRDSCTLDEIKEALTYLDIIVPSYDEAVHFTKKTELKDIAEVLHTYGIPTVVIKCGARGVYAHTASEEIAIGSYAKRVVDTTGAGDNFMAGFISGLLDGYALKDCMRFGSGVSAISIGALGATGAVSSHKQVEDFLQGCEEAIS